MKAPEDCRPISDDGKVLRLFLPWPDPPLPCVGEAIAARNGVGGWVLVSVERARHVPTSLWMRGLRYDGEPPSRIVIVHPYSRTGLSTAPPARLQARRRLPSDADLNAAALATVEMTVQA